MEKLLILDKIKTLYDNGINIIQYLRELDNKTSEEKNSKYDILISYDFQAGSYSQNYDETFKMNYTKRLSDIIKGLQGRKYSILEVGVGEATTLTPLLNHGNLDFKKVYGFDISWSRIKFAQKFLRDHLKACSTSHGGGG